MDYGESSESWDEGVSIDDEEDWEEIPLEMEEDPAPVTVAIQFKSGMYKEWTFTLPKQSEAYDGTITRAAMNHVITNAYSYGEAPFVVLPMDDGSNVFVDLNATDYMELR